MNESKPIYVGRDLEGMSFAPKYHQWILNSIAHSLGQRVAEVGAGSGNFTRLLVADERRRISSFEPSENMFSRLDALRLKCNNLEAYNSFLSDKAEEFSETFDSVLYINVLEHIEDDGEELKNAHNVLKEDGKLIIFVPALNALYSCFDQTIGHFRRYHKKPLCDLVGECGYKVETAAYFDIAGIVPWYVFFVLLKSENIPGSVVLYDNLVVPIMSRLEKLLVPPIGKNLLLVATKKRKQEA